MRWPEPLLALALVGAGGALAQTPKPAGKPVTVAGKPPLVRSTALPPCWAVAYSPDGATLAVGTYRQVLIYDADGTRRATWTVSNDAVRAVAFSPDGKLLAIGTGVPGAGGQVKLLDAATGTLVRAWSGHTDTVESVAFAGERLLSAADDETVRLTETATGKAVGTLTEHIGRCLAVAVPSKLSDDTGGALFATAGADKMLKIWDADLRRVVVNFDQCQGTVWSVAATPQPGRFVAGADDGSVRLFGIYREKPPEKPDPTQPLPRGGYVALNLTGGHEGPVYAVAASEASLFSGGADGKIAIWNYGGGRERTFSDALGDIYGLAVSPDGKRLAAASRDGHVRVYDLEQRKLVQELPPAPPPPTPKAPTGPLGTGTGLWARYYQGRALDGLPVLTRLDPRIDFDFAHKPDGRAPQNEFSVRWEGFVEAPVTGEYLFHTLSDDGVRLAVGGRPVIDNWTDHGTTEDRSVPIALTAGQRVFLRMEYYQGNADAVAQLLWTPPGQERQVIPTNRLYPAGGKATP
jgi:hypothetical protein